jgi:hypothetical protein
MRVDTIQESAGKPEYLFSISIRVRFRTWTHAALAARRFPRATCISCNDALSQIAWSTGCFEAGHGDLL